MERPASAPRDRYAKRKLAACKTLASPKPKPIERAAAHTASANSPADCATLSKKKLVGSSGPRLNARACGTGPKQTQAKTSRGSKSPGSTGHGIIEDSLEKKWVEAGPLLDDDDEDVALRRSGLACVFTSEGSMMNNGSWVKVAADLENLTYD